MVNCRYNLTLSPSCHARVGVAQGSCISSFLFNFFCVHIPPDRQPTRNSYADYFTDSYFNPNVPQMTVALTDHTSRVEAWVDEWGLTISAPVSFLSLTPETKQFSTHPHVTLTSSLLPLEKRHRILGITLDTHFSFDNDIFYQPQNASYRRSAFPIMLPISRQPLQPNSPSHSVVTSPRVSET